MSSIREGDLSASSSRPLRDEERARAGGAGGGVEGAGAAGGGGGGGGAARRAVRPNAAWLGEGRRARRRARRRTVAARRGEAAAPARRPRGAGLISCAVCSGVGKRGEGACHGRCCIAHSSVLAKEEGSEAFRRRLTRPTQQALVSSMLIEVSTSSRPCFGRSCCLACAAFCQKCKGSALGAK
jgi:hypothetical protein